MPVIVNNCLIEPAPFVSISKSVILAGNQTKLGQTYSLTIEGTLVAWKGSPNGGSLNGSNWGGPYGLFWTSSAPAPDETGVLQFHKLYNIEQKQRALEYLFSINGSMIEWESPDGSQPLKAQFKNANVQYPAGNWAQICPYTITAECDILYLNGTPVQDAPFSDLIQNANENWNIQVGEIVKTFSIQHEVSAVGKIAFDNAGNTIQPAWKAARDFCNDQLVLGFSGTSAYSSIAGGTIFNQSSLGSGVLNFNGYLPYNFARNEVVDEIAGTYAVTESWILAAASSGTNIYTVTTNKMPEDPYTTISVSLQGTIHGFYDGLFNYDQRLPAAEYLWAQLNAPTGLLTLISPYTPGFTFNSQPLQGSVDYNVQDGTLSYQYQFSNKLFEGDAFEQYTVSKKVSVDDYKTTFTVNGTIQGRKYEGDLDTTIAFQRAYTWWSTLSGSTTLYNRVLSSQYFPEASGMGIQIDAIGKDVDFNQAAGIVTYSWSFNNRRNESDLFNDSVIEEFQISRHFSVDEAITTYSINGSIQGLNITDTNPQQSKYNAASGYYYGVVNVAGFLYGRIQRYYGVNLPNTNPLVTEVVHFPMQGQITYSQEFRNTFPPLLLGVLSEHIVISEENPDQTVNVFGAIGIIGRGNGPILQDMSTTTVKTRTLSLEAVLPPTGGPDLLACLNAKPDYTTYVLQIKPTNSFTEQDGDNWDFKMGRYTRQTRWTYE